MKRPPAAILCASDLGPRCDRALERAMLLAMQQNAVLHVAHALPSSPAEEQLARATSSDPAANARQRLGRQIAMLAALPPSAVHLHVRPGAPADILPTLAGETGAGLLVTGAPRLFGRQSTVEQLGRRTGLPLLMVREPAVRPYQDILFTTDFSPRSRAILRRSCTLAASCFPEARLTLFHAYDAPYALYLGKEHIEEMLRREGARLVQDFLGEAEAAPIASIVEYGTPEVLLKGERFRSYLGVVGSHGGGLLYDALVGSTARRIATAFAGDILFLPA